MGKLIKFEDYRHKKDKDNLFKDDSLYERFFDYEGQMIYDNIFRGKKIDKAELKRWGCSNENEFLNTWRGNTEEAYIEWLKLNNLK